MRTMRSNGVRGATALAASLLAAAMILPAGCGIVRGRSGMESTAPSAPAVTTSPAGTEGGGSDARLYGDSKSSSGAADSAAGVPPDAQASSEGAATVDSGRLMVRTKSMLVRVKDVQAAVARIRSLTASYGGTIESLTISDATEGPIYRDSATSQGRPLAGWVAVRVPVARFERFVEDSTDLGKVLRQSQDARDVTRQHVDLEARLQNLRAEEARLREMFDRATKVSDMLDVERELARVRGEAEALQAEIDVLENQAAMATITFELVEPEPIVRPQGIDWGVADALTEGLRAFVGTLNGMIVAAMGLAPLALLIAAVALVVRALVRRRRPAATGSARPEPAAPKADDGD